MVKRLKVQRKRLSVYLPRLIGESVKEKCPGECPPRLGRGDSNPELSENSLSWRTRAWVGPEITGSYGQDKRRGRHLG